MSRPIIEVHGLTKQYRLGVIGAPSFRDELEQLWRKVWKRKGDGLRRSEGASEQIRGDRFNALRGVSFDVMRGEVLGIIGLNGAGKSTLLKILSRITEPTSGWARLRGHVASLLEVGTGFHPELTGRENVYLNGTILGMKRIEIERKFDEIVSFSAGVEDFIDTPVKRYSSGMFVRLAFAVAAHLEPEILIVDEVLAVGDLEFQKRCLGKMKEVSALGRTVLFVSHNMGSIQQLCSRALFLHHGLLVKDGESAETVRYYLKNESESEDDKGGFSSARRSGAGGILITSARILDCDGNPCSNVVSGNPVTFEFEYENKISAPYALLSTVIFNQNHIPVTKTDMPLTGATGLGLGTRGRFRCKIDKLNFPLGSYSVAVAVDYNETQQDVILNALEFTVNNSVFFPAYNRLKSDHCVSLIEHHWEHESSEEARQGSVAADSES